MVAHSKPFEPSPRDLEIMDLYPHMTAKEIARKFDVEPHTISARITLLRSNGCNIPPKTKDYNRSVANPQASGRNKDQKQRNCLGM